MGYGSDDDSEFKKYWPADVHVVGKEIVRFHTIIWPAMLMALDLPLPKQVFGHGWLIIDGGKMSKSKGNVVDPKVLVDRYGVDAIRYFLLREIAFGQDGNFTNEALIQRINSDLANDLGNLVSRTVGMIEKYFDGKVPADREETEFDASLKDTAKAVTEKVDTLLDKMLFSDALTEIWTLIRRSNKYVDETQPWVLAKDDSQKAKLANVLYNLSEAIRIVSVLIQPFMPNTPKLIWKQLGVSEGEATTWDSAKTWGVLPADTVYTKGDVIFPRIDMKKELAELEAAMKAAQAASVANQEKKAEEEQKEEPVPEITIDDFDKIKLKVGTVIASEKMPGSKKLLKNQIKIGNETRQILSGISPNYTPEEMVGKKVIVLTNLPPRKMMGEMSYGMILVAEDENGELSLASVDKADFADGSSIS